MTVSTSSLTSSPDLWGGRRVTAGPTRPFGCCLYEALTGKSVFLRETVSDTIAAILEGEPDWNAVPESTPWRVRELLRRCLRKDANERLHDIADARIEINDALAEPARSAPEALPARSRAWMPVLVAAIAVVAAFSIFRGDPLPQPVKRFVVQLPPGESLADNQNLANVAMSPDGSLLVYVGARTDGTTGLYSRAMGAFDPEPVPGSPFFSPDGEWLGFFADGELKKRRVSGGPVITLCDAPRGRGASWGPDDTIVFTPTQGGTLSMVSAAGGAPQVLTTKDVEKNERYHYWPEFLPGGKAVLFTVGGARQRYVAVHSFETGERHVLLEGDNGRYVRTGHLVYNVGGSLLVAPFDRSQLRLTGNPIPVLEGVRLQEFFAAHFTVAGDGTLAYVPGEGVMVRDATLLWLVPRIFNYYTKSGSPCVSSVRWAKRAIDSRIWSADLVHLNGFGSSLWASR